MCLARHHAHRANAEAPTNSLGVAELLGSHPPGAEGHVETITAAEARRLAACTAAIIPVVLGGDSQPLDLGRTRRLFNGPRRRAMRLRDRECRADRAHDPAYTTSRLPNGDRRYHRRR